MKTKETMKSEVSTVPQWLKGFCRYDVEIFYEHIPKGIYIYSIISKQPRQGNGTKALREFIDLFGEYSDLWLFCDDELGTDTDTLYSWYAKFGFVPTKELISEYNVTHKRQATRHIGI